jgi:uncharacterized protein YqiB (DUF1249 family)
MAIRQPPVKIKLSEFQFQCDLNYLRLRKLFADGRQSPLYLSMRHKNAEKKMYLDIRSTKNSRYTHELSICLRLMAIPEHQHARFVVHIYRDVCSAEIIYYQDRALVDLREKYHLNRLLGKWLSRYLMHGHEVAPS